jgi:hypothetical protein
MYLQRTIELSACLGVLLVVLCSKQTKVEQVAQRVSKTIGARSLIVEIPETWSHRDLPRATSAPTFLKASADRACDLSAKRNIGLLLARLHGWTKIVFVDDDITSLETSNLVGLAKQLENHKVAGMVVHDQFDNSVVCHARRLGGQWQDIFVTGAVMGVHCGDLPLSFFPDIYNEDWFFFVKEAAARDLPNVGRVTQAWYDPFASPERARREEFGDLLAEGLYALISRQDASLPFKERLRKATKTYWSYFIEARHDVIADAQAALYSLIDHGENIDHPLSALNSLEVAESQLANITADLCVSFFNAWRDDQEDWHRFSNRINNVGSTPEAMDFLQLKTWILADFGGVVDHSRNRVVHGEASTADIGVPQLDPRTGVDFKAPVFDGKTSVVDPGPSLSGSGLHGGSEIESQPSFKPPGSREKLSLASRLKT